MYDYFNNAIFICGILALLFAAVSFCHLAKVYNTYCDLLETLKGGMEKMDSFSDDIRRQVRERIDVIGNSLQEEVRKHYAGVMKRGGKYMEFPSPGRTFSGETVRVIQVLPDGNCLVLIVKHDYSNDEDITQPAYMVLKEKEKYRYYDNEEIKISEDTVIIQAGIFQYRSGCDGSAVRTVPAIKVLGL